MASYIPNITDNTQQIPVGSTMPQSNYQFLQTQMDKANAMYESGFQEVKSGYASIVNAPVTGIEANERKQKYIQQAQNKLRTLSSKDLSLPQNVAQAETAYAPFWEDDLLIQNTANTRFLHKNNSQLDNWLYSNDEETRSLYNDKNRAAIQEATMLLANTPMTKEAYAGLSGIIQDKARAIPYYDINKDIDEAWNLRYGSGIDKGISSTHLSGLGMITDYNGPQSYDAYKTWILSHLSPDSKYMPQLKQQAWLEVQEARKKVMYENPTITDPKQVDNILAKNRMQKLKEVYSSRENVYSGLLDSYANQLNDLRTQVYVDQGGQWDESQKAAEQALLANIEGYTNLYNNTKLQGQKYNELVDDKPNPLYFQTLTDIATNPDDYVTNLLIDNIADSWATGRASVTARKVEVNPIEDKIRHYQNEDRKHWVEVQKLLKEKEKLDIEREQLQLTARGQAWDLYKTTGKLSPFGPTDSNFRGGKLGWATTWNGENIGGVVSDATEQINHLEKTRLVQEKLNAPRDIALNTMLNIDATGFGGIVLGDNGLKLTDKEQDTFARYMKKMVDRGQVSDDPEGKAVWDKVKNKLKTAGVIKNTNDILGPWGMQSALDDYGNKDVADGLRKLGSDAALRQLQALQSQSSSIKANMLQYTDGREKFDKEVLEKASKDARFKKLLVDGKRMVESNDIEKILPNEILAYDPATDKEVKLNKADIANAYLTDSFSAEDKLAGFGEVTINGATYRIYNTPFNKKQKENYRNLDRSLRTIRERFGTPKDINTLRTKLVGELSSAIEYKDGALYKKLTRDPNDEDKEVANKTIQDIQQHAPIANTTMFYYIKPGESAPTFLQKEDPAKVEKLRELMSSTPEIQKYVANFQQIKQLREAAITLRDISDGPLKDLSGKTIYMKYTPTASDKLTAHLPDDVISGPLSNLQKRGVFTSPDSMKGVYEATLTGVGEGPDGGASKVIYNKKYWINGVMQTQKVTYDLYGKYAKNLQEIYEIYNQDVANTLANQQVRKQVKNQEISARVSK